MDGSTIVIPAAAPPGGLARKDALFRIVYYGEALKAMTEHVSDALISGPCGPMIDLLDEAFDRMSETRDSFGPEEFTLFVMSKMLGLCEDADEARQFQVGAARYILRSANALPDAYQAVVEDAKEMLARADLPDDAPRPLPRAQAARPAETETETETMAAEATVQDPPKTATAIAAPAARASGPARTPSAPAASATDAVRPGSARVTRGGRDALSRHGGGTITRRPMAFARRGSFRRAVETIIVLSMIIYVVAVVVLFLTGQIDIPVPPVTAGM